MPCLKLTPMPIVAAPGVTSTIRVMRWIDIYYSAIASKNNVLFNVRVSTSANHRRQNRHVSLSC